MQEIQTFRPHMVAYAPPIAALLVGGGLLFPARRYLTSHGREALYSIGGSISGMHHQFFPEIVKGFDLVAIGAGGLVVLWSLAALLAAFIRLQTSRLTISRDQVVWRTGWLNLIEKSVAISEIIGINLEQSLAGRLLGFGKIDIETRGVDHIRISGIESPDVVQGLLRRLKSAHGVPAGR